MIPSNANRAAIAIPAAAPGEMLEPCDDASVAGELVVCGKAAAVPEAVKVVGGLETVVAKVLA